MDNINLLSQKYARLNTHVPINKYVFLQLIKSSCLKLSMAVNEQINLTYQSILRLRDKVKEILNLCSTVLV
jgi:hypothetical protein